MRKHTCYKTGGNPSWEHAEDNCTCQCDPCQEYMRTKSLSVVSSKEIDDVWNLLEGAALGPWKAIQMPGFGAMRFIVSEHPKNKWHQVVAILENPGSFQGDQFIAWCREGVPRLLNTIEQLQKRIEELEKKDAK